MTTALTATTHLAPGRGSTFIPAVRRGGMAAVIAAVLIVGFLATSAQATNLAIVGDGTALVRLIRFMAVIKGGMVMAAAAAVLWGLGTPVSLPWFAAYGITCASMAAGPGLIWGLTHVGLGAILLHGGLLATIILVWLDPKVSIGLANIVAARSQRKTAQIG